MRKARLMNKVLKEQKEKNGNKTFAVNGCTKLSLQENNAPPPGRNSEGSCLFLFNIKNPTVESLITPLVLEQPTLFTRSMFGRNSKISREPASK